VEVKEKEDEKSRLPQKIQRSQDVETRVDLFLVSRSSKTSCGVSGLLA
jgi:hypothetical protein